MTKIKFSKTILITTIIILILISTIYSNLFQINGDDYESKETADVPDSNLPGSEDSNENDFIVGPGLPAPEDMVYWYVPDSLKDNRLDPSPYFPAISQYSDSMSYTRRTMMTVWYFKDIDDLKRGEKELHEYLEEHGQLNEDAVDITEQLVEVGNTNPINGPTNLTVTRYESKETSGYFAVIVKPFGENLNNYFIIYYGTNEKLLDEENDTIKKLMAKEYYMGNKKGYVRGLIN